MVGDWDSADGERGFELQFALPIVRVGTQSPGIPKGGPGGKDIVPGWSYQLGPNSVVQSHRQNRLSKIRYEAF